MIKELIFNQNKYIQATNGDEVLIAVTDGSNLEITDKRTGARDQLESHDSFLAGQETIERHTPCLAWVTNSDKGEYYYTIKDFVGDVYKYDDYSHGAYDQFNNYLASKTLTVKKDEVIGFAV